MLEAVAQASMLYSPLRRCAPGRGRDLTMRFYAAVQRNPL